MASLSCSVTYILVLLQGLTFMAEQAQALKAEAPVGRYVCLVSNWVWQVSLLLFVILQARLDLC